MVLNNSIAIVPIVFQLLPYIYDITKKEIKHSTSAVNIANKSKITIPNFTSRNRMVLIPYRNLCLYIEDSRLFAKSLW